MRHFGHKQVRRPPIPVDRKATAYGGVSLRSSCMWVCGSVSRAGREDKEHGGLDNQRVRDPPNERDGDWWRCRRSCGQGPEFTGPSIRGCSRSACPACSLARYTGDRSGARGAMDQGGDGPWEKSTKRTPGRPSVLGGIPSGSHNVSIWMPPILGVLNTFLRLLSTDSRVLIVHGCPWSVSELMAVGCSTHT